MQVSIFVSARFGIEHQRLMVMDLIVRDLARAVEAEAAVRRLLPERNASPPTIL